MSLNTDITRIRTQLIKKAKTHGLWENFGQNEVKKLSDKYGKDQRHGGLLSEIALFNEWCINVSMEDLK